MAEFDESKHPRGPDGKFGAGAASNLAKETKRRRIRVLSRVKLAEVAAQGVAGGLGPDQGATIDPQTAKPVHEGYAVSTHRDREMKFKLPDDMPEAEAHAEYAKRAIDFVVNNRGLLAQEGNHFGVWYDKNDSKQWFFDVSSVVKSPEEAETLGRKHDQLAAYDLKNKKEIRFTHRRESDG